MISFPALRKCILSLVPTVVSFFPPPISQPLTHLQLGYRCMGERGGVPYLPRGVPYLPTSLLMFYPHTHRYIHRGLGGGGYVP